MTNKWKKSIMWISVSITVSIAVIVTKNISCLYEYIFPVLTILFDADLEK